MINELYDLASTLKEISDLEIPPLHNQYNAHPAKNCYRIWLDDNGKIAGIEAIDDSLREKLLRYGQKLTTFPAFKIAALFRVKSAEDISYFRALLDGKADVDVDRLKDMCNQDNWEKSLYDKVTRCLSLPLPIAEQNKAIDKLMQITKSMSVQAFRKSLEQFVWDALDAGHDNKLMMSVLIGVEKPSTKDWQGSIFLDVKSYEKYDKGYPISSKYITDEINTRLFEYENTREKSCGDESVDAFGDQCDANELAELMPAVNNVPVLGEIKLRSLNKDIPCQSRYRIEGSLTYPIGSKNRELSKDALRYISGKSQEGITWQRAKDAAVYVYPDKQPEVSLRLASLFGGGTDENKNSISRFEDIAKEIANTLKGIPPKKRPKDIRVFSIGKVDKARRKIELSYNLTPDALVKAAEDWQNGFTNIPLFDFKTGGALFPLQVSEVFNKVWKQSGESKLSVPLMRYYHGIEILLGIYNSSMLIHHLRGLLANGEGLIVYAGNQLPRNKFTDKQYEAIGNMLPLFGLLLHKLSYQKEDYMENPAFLFGQILKISDGLHALYCKEKRNGDIPPQLAGNSVFISATENPSQALALLGTRMSPYLAWAKQAMFAKSEGDDKVDKSSGLAIWYMKLFEDVMTKLAHQITPNIRFADIDKAQVFIGYLAKLPKMEDLKNKDAKSVDEEDNKNE